MNAIRKRSLRMVAVGFVAAVTLTFTPIGSAQAVDVGGSATGTGTYGVGPATLTLAVTGTPQAATGPVTFTSPFSTFTGVARCIAVRETPTGRRASIAGEITGGTLFADGFRGFEVTVYDNTPSAQIDQVSGIFIFFEVRTSCAFEKPPDSRLIAGDFIVTAEGACPPSDDEDNDGLTDNNENFFTTLLGNTDSDFDGIADGNDDANGNGDDDEDEDDDEDDECPDEDSDGDGEDDEDEDDDEDDD